MGVCECVQYAKPGVLFAEKQLMEYVLCSFVSIISYLFIWLYEPRARCLEIECDNHLSSII